MSKAISVQSITVGWFPSSAHMPNIFRDNETPSGTVNGVNTAFTLAATPFPAESLQLFLNGQCITAVGADYTLSGSSITMAIAPATGDVLRAWYRTIA